MLTFSRFLPDEGSIYKVILSLLHELPSTEATADILAEHFYDADNLDVEVQEKLEKFLDSWKSVFIEPEDDGKSAKPEQQEVVEDDEADGRKSVTFFEASPRGKTLSVYFTKQCEVVMKVLKKKSKMYGVYEEFVFDESGKIPCGTLTSTMPLDKSVFSIGSRPFETKISYLEFLDTFSAITYTKLLDAGGSDTTVHHPLLLPFSEDICKTEFEEIQKRVKRLGEKSAGLMILSSPSAKASGAGNEDSLPETEHGWSLDVNFGKKYDRLKQILQWLAIWSRKQHSLGLHWKGEKDLVFKPAMRIDISPNLVLLSLWLVEHKYCPIVKQKPSVNGSSLESQSNQQSQIEYIAKEVNAQVLQAVRQRSKGKYLRRKQDRNQSSGGRSGSVGDSWDSQGHDEDTNQIKSAYEDVLNGFVCYIFYCIIILMT